jgi:uncharacterized protein
MQRSLDFFLPRTGPNSWVSFYGGEPTLEWDLIEKAVRYLHDTDARRSDMRFHVTTNASLLDERKIDFLTQHRGELTASLDGPAGVHDRMRRFQKGKGTFARVMKSLILMR